MTDHNEAMRLADAIETAVKQTDTDDQVIFLARWFAEPAAALLRQLSAERDQLRAEVERLRVERDRWYASFEHVSRILSGIHALMYPEPFTLSDGRTVVFRPKDPGPHEMLQALSDRIRAIPDEVAAIDAARTTHKETE